MRASRRCGVSEMGLVRLEVSVRSPGQEIDDSCLIGISCQQCLSVPIARLHLKGWSRTSKLAFKSRPVLAWCILGNRRVLDWRRPRVASPAILGSHRDIRPEALPMSYCCKLQDYHGRVTCAVLLIIPASCASIIPVCCSKLPLLVTQ